MTPDLAVVVPTVVPKIALTYVSARMLMDSGLLLPLASPPQPRKTHGAVGVAAIETAALLKYLDPALGGVVVTAPPPSVVASSSKLLGMMMVMGSDSCESRKSER